MGKKENTSTIKIEDTIIIKYLASSMYLMVYKLSFQDYGKILTLFLRL